MFHRMDATPYHIENDHKNREQEIKSCSLSLCKCLKITRGFCMFFGAIFKVVTRGFVHFFEKNKKKCNSKVMNKCTHLLKMTAFSHL